MGKRKSKKQNANAVLKHGLHEVKSNSMKKKKNRKFKNIPANNVSSSDLITMAKDKQSKNKTSKNQKYSPTFKTKNKNIVANVGQKSPKQNAGPSKEKKNSPKVTPNKQINKKMHLSPKNNLEEMDDSDPEIDQDETSEDENISDTDVPNILGKSLADNSDDDDEDFEAEEDDDENIEAEEEDEEIEAEEESDEDSEQEDDNDVSDNQEAINKGVKMFKGVKPMTGSSQNEESETDDDDDDDDDEEEEEEDTDIHKFKKSLITANTVDDTDDEAEDEEDEDEEDEDDENGQIEDESEEEEDDSDDDEEAEETDDDIEAKKPGLKALLGASIVDDDDDEDFDEEDEDDEDDEDDALSDEDEEDEENDGAVQATEAKINKTAKDDGKTKQLSPEEREEIDNRTVYIDNIPKETTPANIKEVFSQFGPISNLRFRGIIPENLNMSKKIAAQTNKIHPKLKTVVVLVTFKSQKSAKAALAMNGKTFEGNYMNVRIVAKSEQKEYDKKKAVFLGSLNFGIDNNAIWKCFGECGEIESVHLIRDRHTGICKGFGYVNFKSEDAVPLALKLDGVEIMNRPVRVSLYSPGGKSQKKPRHRSLEKKRELSGDSDDHFIPSKKLKNNSQKAVVIQKQNSQAGPKKVNPQANAKKQSPQANTKKQSSQKNSATSPQKQNSMPFQGQKANLKKKKEESKFDKKKKKLAKPLTAKSKKVAKA